MPSTPRSRKLDLASLTLCSEIAPNSERMCLILGREVAGLETIKMTSSAKRLMGAYVNAGNV